MIYAEVFSYVWQQTLTTEIPDCACESYFKINHLACRKKHVLISINSCNALNTIAHT